MGGDLPIKSPFFQEFGNEWADAHSFPNSWIHIQFTVTTGKKHPLEVWFSGYQSVDF
jgi:hypothetical protein